MVKAFITIRSGSQVLGRLDLVLFDDSVPKTVANFCELLKRRQFGRGFLNSSFHRLIRGFMIQGGDITKGDGTGGESIYGESFPDENFIHSHDKIGVLSMANSGKDTNSSQFFITFRPTPHLDGKHVVFGHVDMTKSGSVMRLLESIKTGASDRPAIPLTIVDCGLVEEESRQGEEQDGDDNEISLEGEEDEGTNANINESGALKEKSPIDPPEEVEEEAKPKTKAEALRLRMRKLKMKMNQARQLNKQEVVREGERLGSVEGAEKARKRQAMQDKKLKEAAWASRNAKALAVASDHGIDGKHLVEQAGESLVRTLYCFCLISWSRTHIWRFNRPPLFTNINSKKLTKRAKRVKQGNSELMTSTIRKDSTETIAEI